VNDPTGGYTIAYDNMGRQIGTATQYAFLPGKTSTAINVYDAASNDVPPANRTRVNMISYLRSRVYQLNDPTGGFICITSIFRSARSELDGVVAPTGVPNVY